MYDKHCINFKPSLAKVHTRRTCGHLTLFVDTQLLFPPQTHFPFPFTLFSFLPYPISFPHRTIFTRNIFFLTLAFTIHFFPLFTKFLLGSLPCYFSLVLLNSPLLCFRPDLQLKGKYNYCSRCYYTITTTTTTTITTTITCLLFVLLLFMFLFFFLRIVMIQTTYKIDSYSSILQME